MTIIARKAAEAEDVLPIALCKKPQYQSFLRKFKEGEDPLKMKVQAGATLVPLTDMQGDIPNEVSPYGTVVQGENFGPNMRVTGLVDMRPLAARDRVARRARPAARPGSDLDAAEIRAICAQPSAGQLPEEPAALMARAAHNGAALDDLQSPSRPTVQVELVGPFGKARLTCRAVELHANMVVLVQELGANAFEPPPTEKPCTLTCEEPAGAWTSKVYAIGMAFPVRSLGVFVQVFMLES